MTPEQPPANPQSTPSNAWRAAQSFIETLDSVIGVYEHPAGHVAVNGVLRGKIVYKLFRSV